MSKGIEEIQLTVWRCPDGHNHQSKEIAERCVRQRPQRNARLERRKLWDQQAKERREEYMRLTAERETAEKAMKDACLLSEVGTALPERAALALYRAGISNREQFISECVTPENTFDLHKLARVSGLTIDDYPSILKWVNSA